MNELTNLYAYIGRIEAKLDILLKETSLKKQNEDLQHRNTELVLENRELKEKLNETQC